MLAVLASAGAVSATGSNGSRSTQIVYAADLTPRISGDIYRVDLDGRLVNLTHSPTTDTDPAVSPDGKRIAFFSDRSGSWAVYVMGIDGRGLRRVSRALEAASGIFWSPDGRRLAVGAPGHGSGFLVVSSHVPSSYRGPAVTGYGPATNIWSPDGRLIISVSDLGLTASTPSGRFLWAAPGTNPALWSAKGLIATEVLGHRIIRGRKYTATSVHVYDERGRLRAVVPDTQFSWTADGKRLVTIDQDHVMKVWADGGTRLVLRRFEPLSSQILWAGSSRIVGNDFTIDLATGAGKGFPPAWGNGPVSADGTEIVTGGQHGLAVSLGVARVGGTSVRTLVRTRGCANRNSIDSTIENVQFTPDGHSLVYDTYCQQPYSNLYSLGSDGKQTRLTHDAAIEDAPALSPDGRHIAYARTLVGDGYQASIWVADADGRHAHQVTSNQDCGDSSPSWSPDGKWIVYGIENCDNPEFRLGIVSLNGRGSRVIRVPGESPIWGPQGIAYTNANGGLWIVKPDGKGAQPLSNLGQPLAWSGDGRLAYVEQIGSRASINVVFPGHARLRIRLQLKRVTSLDWSPDGKSFVLVGGLGRDVYTVGTDGKHLRRLTVDMGASTASWR